MNWVHSFQTGTIKVIVAGISAHSIAAYIRRTTLTNFYFILFFFFNRNNITPYCAASRRYFLLRDIQKRVNRD
jgi:hypothetical protein